MKKYSFVEYVIVYGKYDKMGKCDNYPIEQQEKCGENILKYMGKCDKILLER